MILLDPERILMVKTARHGRTRRPNADMAVLFLPAIFLYALKVVAVASNPMVLNRPFSATHGPSYLWFSSRVERANSRSAFLA